jgi:hypothetical protein
MSRPTSLAAPALNAYPFINLMYEDMRTFDTKFLIASGIEYPAEKWTFNDKIFRAMHFASADMVTADHFAPLEAMTDNTFQKLIGSFDLTIADVEIKSRSDLLAAVSKEVANADHDSRFHHASPQQISTWLLNDHARQASIHWGHVVRLYNESTPDQQEAIHRFFQKCLNRSLEDLLSMPGPLPLDAAIEPAMDTKNVDGITHVFPEKENEWIREDRAYNLFTVFGYRGPKTPNAFRENTYMIAGARTFEEAVAYATRYTQGIDEKDTILRIAIDYLGVEVCSGQVVGTGPQNPNKFYHSLPAKLDWEPAKDSPLMSPSTLQWTLIRMEQKLGVQWSKVKKLDDELGL